VWFFKSLGAGPCAAAGPGPVLTGGASPSENSPVARAVRRLGGVDDGNGGPDDGCEVLAKVTRSRWLRRGLDVADAALTHLGGRPDAAHRPRRRRDPGHHPVEWDALSANAERHGLTLIDDSCEALGAEYRGRRIGGFGAAAAFAFYPNKQMTTGEGGVIVTRDGRLAGLVKSLRNQGRAEGSAWLEHLLLGYNYRMDELSAALGISQLKRIEAFLTRRERVAARYSALLRGFQRRRKGARFTLLVKRMATRAAVYSNRAPGAFGRIPPGRGSTGWS
jgi:hypothetical protein